MVCELILYTTGRGLRTYIFGDHIMKISDYGEAKRRVIFVTCEMEIDFASVTGLFPSVLEKF